MTPIFFSINFPPSGLDTDIGETTTCIFHNRIIISFYPLYKRVQTSNFFKKNMAENKTSTTGLFSANLT